MIAITVCLVAKSLFDFYAPARDNSDNLLQSMAMWQLFIVNFCALLIRVDATGDTYGEAQRLGFFIAFIVGGGYIAMFAVFLAPIIYFAYLEYEYPRNSEAVDDQETQLSVWPEDDEESNVHNTLELHTLEETKRDVSFERDGGDGDGSSDEDEKEAVVQLDGVELTEISGQRGGFRTSSRPTRPSRGRICTAQRRRREGRAAVTTEEHQQLTLRGRCPSFGRTVTRRTAAPMGGAPLACPPVSPSGARRLRAG